ncbi:hypothetical protein D3C78_1873890 [compost metagenome]
MRSLTPAEHHAHAVEALHDRADGVSHAFARALGDQIGVAILFDDYQTIGVVGKGAVKGDMAIAVGAANYALLAIFLQ